MKKIQFQIIFKLPWNYSLIGQLLNKKFPNRYEIPPTPFTDKSILSSNPFALPLEQLFIDNQKVIQCNVNRTNKSIIVATEFFDEMASFLMIFNKVMENRLNLNDLIRYIEFTGNITIFKSKENENLLEKIKVLEKSQLKNELSKIFDENFDVFKISFTNSNPLDDNYFRISFEPSPVAPDREVVFNILHRFKKIEDLHQFFKDFNKKIDKVVSLLGE